MINPLNKIHVYWCSLRRMDEKDNFGDILGKYLIEKISTKKIIKVEHPSMRRYKFLIKHYLTVGSILEVANNNSIVWGSGLIRADEIVKKAKFLAVRGPLTRNRLITLGYNIPEVYGDPAILLPKYYKVKVKKCFKLGIIPHYVNYSEVITKFGNNKDINVIDILTNNVEKTINEILKCELVLSSSLHGIIVSHTYKIPALWGKFENSLAGDNVKFYDYFESVGLKYKNEYSISNLNYEMIISLIEDNIDILLPSDKLLDKRRNDLLESCPF